MAGEVCRAFETAGCTPPEDLKKLWDEYCEKMREEGIEVHTGGGGYSGHGFKYDFAEDETEANRRKFTKLIHGMEAGADEDDEDIADQLLSVMKSKRRVVERGGKSGGGGSAKAVEAKIAAARAAAEKIASEKQLNVQQPMEKDATSLTAEAIMRGEEAAPITLSVSAGNRSSAATATAPHPLKCYSRLHPLRNKRPSS